MIPNLRRKTVISLKNGILKIERDIIPICESICNLMLREDIGRRKMTYSHIINDGVS
jgi:hypothetical protein